MTAAHATLLSRTVCMLGADDWPVIAGLAHAIWPIAYADILTREQVNNMLERIYCKKNLLQEMMDGHVFWATYEEDTPTGYASAYREGSTVWLKKLYVLPKLQGRGFGRMLTDTILSHFMPAEEIKLLVNRENIAAQRFYARLGFTCVEEIPVKMGDFNFIDLVFSKPL